MITNEAAEKLLSDMVRIESVTPWLIPDGAGEAACAIVRGRLGGRSPGARSSLVEIAPGRVNTLVRLRGTGGGPTLCVNAHIDTVGYANWRDRALTPAVDGDIMVGLGAADDKAGCVAALLALRELASRTRPSRRPARGAGGRRGRRVDRHRGAARSTDEDAAMMIVEPDKLPRAIVEHQGFGWIDVVVHGKPAHGSAPEEGVDAIVHMAEVVQRLHRLDAEVFAPNADPMNGRTVFHTGTIRGGTDYATYPGSAVLGIEIGTQPGEHLSDRVRDIETIFDEVRGRLPASPAEVVGAAGPRAVQGRGSRGAVRGDGSGQRGRLRDRWSLPG